MVLVPVAARRWWIDGAGNDIYARAKNESSGDKHGQRNTVCTIPDFWHPSRGGLVGYDAALTQLRSWVQFPFLVICASGLVVKSNVAIVGPRVRFSAGAFFFSG